MKSVELDSSMKYLFLGLHLLFLLGAVAYTHLDQNLYALLFGTSSVLSLLYFVAYQNVMLHRRSQAQINLLEQTMTGETTKEPETVEEEKEKPSLDEVLEKKNVQEAEQFIDQQLEKIEEKEKFLNAVKEAEDEGAGRVTVKNYANEKLIELMKEEA